MDARGEEDDFTAQDWVVVLEQSEKWGCPGIRAAAIAELEKMPMDDALRIATWKKFSLDESQIMRCYHTFGTRDQPVSIAEGDLMGMEMALRLSALRDSVNQGVLECLKESAEGHGGQAMGLQLVRMKDLVCRGLLVEFMSG